LGSFHVDLWGVGVPLYVVVLAALSLPCLSGLGSDDSDSANHALTIEGGFGRIWAESGSEVT